MTRTRARAERSAPPARPVPATQATRRAIGRLALAALAAGVLPGCSMLSSWGLSLPPPPRLDWFSDKGKPAPMPALTPTVTPVIDWQASVGKAGPGFTPAVVGNDIIVANAAGEVMRLDATTGRSAWRVGAGTALSAGVGADENLAVVGSDRGDVVALKPDGSIAWKVSLSSEITAPATLDGGVAVVLTGDGRVFALNAADGKTRWVYQRQNPALVVRAAAPALVSHGGAFVGTAGGRLVALDSDSGVVGWEATVAVPKGATELERIADITSAPVIDGRNVCASAFQGHTLCFDAQRGTSVWSRDIASYWGLVADRAMFYLTDDSGVVLALDKATGTTMWRQDVLKGRRIGGAQVLGDYVAVVDVEGWLHLLSASDGSYVGRVATDGSAATARPVPVGGNRIVWQSRNGTVISASVRRSGP